MCKTVRILILLAVIAGVAVLVVPASSSTWNAAADFSTVSNPWHDNTTQSPQGQWIYTEYFLPNYGHQGTDINYFYAIGYDSNFFASKAVLGGLMGWGYDVNGTSGDYINLTGSNTTIGWNGSSYTILPNQLVLIPDANPSRGAAIQWIAPTTKTYSINATFARPTGGTSSQYLTDVHVVRNGTAVWSAEVQATGTTSQSYTNASLALNQGDVLLFCVSHHYEYYGSGGWLYGNNSTLLDATITDALPPSITISGTVTSTVGGAPVAGVAVEDVSSVGGGGATTTDSAGTYSLVVSTANGARDIKFSRAGFNDLTQTSVPVSSNQTLSVALTPNKGTVSGTVTDGTNPLAGVTVTDVASGASTTSIADGTYKLELVPAGVGRTIQASKSGYGTATLTADVTVGVTTSGKNFVLTASYIRGTVTDSKTSLAIAGARVATSNSTYSTLTATDGSYTLQVAAPFTYNLVATYPNHVPGKIIGVSVSSGANVTGQNFALIPGWDLANDFTTANGNPNGPWAYAYNFNTVVNGLLGNRNLNGSGGRWNQPYDQVWDAAYGPQPGGSSYGLPLFVKNNGSSDASLWVPDQIWSNGASPVIYREAYKVVTNVMCNESNVARFIAPTSGVYSINARWAGVQINGQSSAAVGLKVNNVPVVGSSGTLSGFQGSTVNNYTDSTGSGATPVVTYSTVVSLSQNDIVDSVATLSGNSTSLHWIQTDMSVYQASGTGTISGTVRSDLPGNPGVAGATVTISGGDVPFTVTTASDGTYSVPVLPGSYDLEASTGLAGITTVADIYGVSVSANDSITGRDFTLHHNGNWNVVQDFAPVYTPSVGVYGPKFNPNNQWSYYVGGAPAIWTSFGNFLSNRQVWGSADSNFQKGWISLTRNLPADSPYNWGDGIVATGQLIIAGGSATGGVPSKVVWTSPYLTPTPVSFSVDFVSAEPASLTHKFTGYVYKNAQQIVSKSVQNPAPSNESTYQTNILVGAGDTLSFGIQDQFPNNSAISIKSLTIGPGAGTAYNSLGSLASALQGLTVGSVVFLTDPTVVINGVGTGYGLQGFKDTTFFLEAADRSRGIKCLSGADVPDISAGQKITFTGVVAADPYDATKNVVQIQALTSVTPGTLPLSVGLGSKSITTALTARNMLVRVWGKVTQQVLSSPADPSGWAWQYWVINDGGQDIKIPMNVQTGLMPSTSGILGNIGIGDYISIVGIETVDSTGTLVVYPTVDTSFRKYIP